MRGVFNSDRVRKKYRFMTLVRFTSIFLFAFLLLSAACSAKQDSSGGEMGPAPQFSEKRVLMISSYSPSFRTFFKQIDGVKSVLDPYHIQLDNEFMDTKRFLTDENFRLFHEYLSYKLKNLPPYDAVIAADDDAINFIMNNRDELFGDIPIFFLGVNNYENAVKYSNEKNVTGVFEAPSYHDTIALAQKLNPEAVRVVGLVDSSISGQGDLELFNKEKDQFPNLKFEALDLSNLTFQEFEHKLEQYTPKDIVLMISVYRDKTGTACTYNEGLNMVRQYLDSPLYQTYEHGVGEGILGGKVVSHFVQGESAAKQVLAYFQGTPMDKIPLIDKSPNRYMIDWKILKKYGLSADKLPKDTVFVNKEVTFLDKYGLVLLTSSIVFVLEGIIVAALIYFLQSTRKSRRALMEMNEELEFSIADIRSRDSRIHDLVYVDSLTGLSNRFAIYEKIDEQIWEMKEIPFHIMFLDIDNFKNVNDIFGHDVGDALIRETGRQLKGILSPDIHVGRFGGDEFVFLITGNWNETAIIDYVEKIRLLFKESLKLKGQQFYLTISIGVAKYPEHGKTKEELIKKADIALYEAKNDGKDKYIIYDSRMDAILSEKLSFQDLLRSAFTNQEFEMYYQPLLRLSNKEIIGFEALIRWHHEQLGWVSPYRLITVAEEMGLIVQLGEWIFTEAVKYLKKLHHTSEHKVSISINISVMQLVYSGFYDFVMSTVQKYEVSPEYICLEMTETVFMKRDDNGNDVLKKLGEEGFRIWLDDFGTGYSSLSYLKQFQFDLLKVDQFFTENFVRDDYDRNLIEMVIRIANQKSSLVVAEGVEKKEQYDLLQSMGCDIVQGYYISRPLPAAEAACFLHTWNKESLD